MATRRRWGPIGVAAGLTVTFVILLGIGTVRPDHDRSTTPATAVAETAETKPPWLRRYAPDELPPQFVLFSFDGAGSHEVWQRLLPAAEASGAHLTAFLSGVYLLPDERKGEYTGPGHPQGESAIGFGGTAEQVRERIADLSAAVRAGHEIGTHYNGHFCKGAAPGAAPWTTADWSSELSQFFGILGAAPELKLAGDAVQGGRTPCLEARPEALLPALAARGMDYDASQVSDGIAWPAMHDGVWQFTLPEMRVPALRNRKVIMMDYNLWFGMNRAKEEPARAEEFTTIALDTYRSAYAAALGGNRAPLLVGNHFNDWSGGAFAAAAERFLAEVCTKPDTVCATYSEVIAWMKLQDAAVLDALRALPKPLAG
ncbi:polysaccharide deacetylase [Actinophytocola sp.]|uniref:polysaccharide deacetylase n=1 Tax=Actinophytocola sp. TaxID=1872138 RepID=UPI002D7E2633|nr:polysaccharide deacetylase [Actinophytocola sp.]HET9139306.1 polysaccharide deacetylase [Actinophytocola sp.]